MFNINNEFAAAYSILMNEAKMFSRKSLWQLGRSSTVNHHINCEDAGGGNAEAVEIVKARIFFFTSFLLALTGD